MANGLQIAASGLKAQEWHLDAVSNDIANVSTVGYQQSRTAFSEVLGSSGGVRIDDIGVSAAQGADAQSDNPIAIALDGQGYIQVRTADGATALTRDGDLHIDGARNIATSSGAKLYPPIAVPADVDAADISIGRDGAVTAAGRKLGQITLVDVPAPDALDRCEQRPADADRRQRRRQADDERHGAAGHDRAVERRPRNGPHRHDGRAAQLPAREPRAPHPGSAPRDRERDPPVMSEIASTAVSTAPLPADVRAGSPEDRKLYASALGFEQQLVQQMTSQMTATTDADSTDPDDSDSGSDDGSSTDAASSTIQDQLPQALADGITSAGGLGLAHDLYESMKKSGLGVTGSVRSGK